MGELRLGREGGVHLTIPMSAILPSPYVFIRIYEYKGGQKRNNPNIFVAAEDVLIILRQCWTPRG